MSTGIRRIVFSPTTFHTALFYIGSFVVNLGNYAFHFLLLRLISPSEYGEFSSYLSLLYLLTIPSTAISIMVTKQVAELISRNQLDQLNGLFYFLIKHVLTLGFLISFLLLLVSPLIANLLKVEPQSIYILGLSILTTISSSVINSFLMGQQKLKTFISVSFLTTLVKIISAYILIILGFRVIGAVSAMFIASFIGLLLSLYLIKNIVIPISQREYNIPLKFLAGWSFAYSTASLSLISTDILLVRYFFSQQESGIYAALITLSKTIHFGISPLTLLVIPMVTNRAGRNLPTRNIFLGILTLALGLGLFGVAAFTLFPDLFIAILAGSQYLAAKSLLVPALISMLLFTLNLIMINYFIALSRHKINLGLIVATLLQPLAILFFHTNLVSVILINILIQIALSIWILLFSLTSYRSKNK